MKTTVIIILAVLLTWYVATFGFPFSCDIPAPLEPAPSEPPLPQPPESPDLSLIERDIFDLINKERDDEGLLVLIWDRNLQEQAQKHSELMVSIQNYKDSDLNVYENIYWGISVSPSRLARSCFESWMEYEGYKENILVPSIRRGAVGIASDEMSTFATFMAK